MKWEKKWIKIKKFEKVPSIHHLRHPLQLPAPFFCRKKSSVFCRRQCPKPFGNPWLGTLCLTSFLNLFSGGKLDKIKVKLSVKPKIWWKRAPRKTLRVILAQFPLHNSHHCTCRINYLVLLFPSYAFLTPT